MDGQYTDHDIDDEEEVYRFWIEEEDGLAFPELEFYSDFGVLTLTRRFDVHIDCYIDAQEPFQPTTPTVGARSRQADSQLHLLLSECQRTTEES